MEGTTEGSSSNGLGNTISQALNEICLRENETGERAMAESVGVEGVMFIDGVGCFGEIDFNSLTVDVIKKFKFADLDSAYDFYNEYGRIKGFSVRKSKFGRNSKDEIVSKTFLCSREGERDSKYFEDLEVKREPKSNTRCGCNARLRVHVDFGTNHWYVTEFDDVHNHELLDTKFSGMLRSHRAMKEVDIDQMNNMRKVGISTPKIFSSLASQSGGYQMVGFQIKDMYNQIDKQRRMQDGDAKGALIYLRKLRKLDPLMFWRYSMDDFGKLQHLFWCDGTSQNDYNIFGDVLGFDATYGRNKYKCPVVVFSGVNHHMHTIVFGCAILSDETEVTYVWLLRQFVEAMKGKCPAAVITDGDLAMRNAIKKVFPDSNHRLCSWHLIRNATANIGKPKFTRDFKNCMMGDYEVDEFKEMWDSMVDQYGLKDNSWVAELYEKRCLWANAHMRGKFFAGLRTTSRCEALHSQIGKYIQSGYNLTEFIEHFQRFLEFMRFKEINADYKSCYGDPVLRTRFGKLEEHSAMIYTREVFYVVRDVLSTVGTVMVTGEIQTATTTIFLIAKYCRTGKIWRVSFEPTQIQMKCSCMRLESYGIPCVHIVCVLIYLNITEFPKCLILQRWTKMAKEFSIRTNHCPSLISDSCYMSMCASLLDDCRDLCNLASRSFEDYASMKEKLRIEREELRVKQSRQETEADVMSRQSISELRDPERVRHKGCGSRSSGRGGHGKRVQRCTKCRQEGHNSRRCPLGGREPNDEFSDHHFSALTVHEGDHEHDQDDWSYCVGLSIDD